MSLAEKLQILRNNKRLSQEELADVLDVSRQAVSKWESGQSTPDLKKLIKLAEIYNVTIDSLVKDQYELDTLENQFNYSVNDQKEKVVDVEKNKNTQIIINLNSNGIEYKYTSKRKLFGIPLVDINMGRGLKKAKGIIAIGNVAYGVVAIGFMSLGIISFGLLSVGLFSLGVLAIALLSIGAISIGYISIGAVSIGVFSLGALAIGKYAVGASAIASEIAIGDYAKATNIAIGNSAVGKEAITLNKEFDGVAIDKIINGIRRFYPNLSDFIIRTMESAIRSLLK